MMKPVNDMKVTTNHYIQSSKAGKTKQHNDTRL